MLGYWAFVYEEDGQFWGRFPELKGCGSAADNASDLAVNLTEALGLWVESQKAEGKEIPKPRSLPEVLKIKTEDGPPMAVQHILLLPPSDRAKQVAMSIDERKLAVIDKAAERLGQTRSAFMVNASMAAATSLAANSNTKQRKRM